MQHEHCWHETGVMLTSSPPKVVERCCHCGETHQRDQTLFMDGKVHGPFLRGWQSCENPITIPVIDFKGAAG